MFQILFHRKNALVAMLVWNQLLKDGEFLKRWAMQFNRWKREKGIYKVMLSFDEYEQNLEAANNCPVM